MSDAAGDPIMRWHLTDAYPSALTYYFDEAGVGREIATFTAQEIQRVAV